MKNEKLILLNTSHHVCLVSEPMGQVPKLILTWEFLPASFQYSNEYLQEWSGIPFFLLHRVTYTSTCKYNLLLFYYYHLFIIFIITIFYTTGLLVRKHPLILLWCKTTKQHLTLARQLMLYPLTSRSQPIFHVMITPRGRWRCLPYFSRYINLSAYCLFAERRIKVKMMTNISIQIYILRCKIKCFKYVCIKILSVLYQSERNYIHTIKTTELYECIPRGNCQLTANNPNIC